MIERFLQIIKLMYLNVGIIGTIDYIPTIKDLKFLRKFKSDSTLTEEDALKLGRELNKNLAKRCKKT